MDSAKKEQSKWLVFAFVAVVFLAIIYVARFSNTPTATRADNRDVADEFGFIPDLEQKRDLSTPSSRLVGYWENVDNGGGLLFSPIDHDLRIGTYRIHNQSSGVHGPPFRFKILSEDSSGTKLVIWPYGQNEALRGLSAQLEMDMSRSDITFTIPKHGQSMTEECTFMGDPMLSVYRYVDDKTSP